MTSKKPEPVSTETQPAIDIEQVFEWTTREIERNHRGAQVAMRRIREQLDAIERDLARSKERAERGFTGGMSDTTNMGASLADLQSRIGRLETFYESLRYGVRIMRHRAKARRR